MIEKFFKCILLSDVVLNDKLATEGNMTTLDYIPGSNFLGIVAGKLYEKLDPNESYEIFHSGEVSFGNATISIDNEISYPIPFDFMMVKGEDKPGENQVYLQHLLNGDNVPKDDKGFNKQLKQKRSGFIITSGKVINKLKKSFALKSAQDPTQRRSKEGAMFGFESLNKGQEFIFSIQFQDDRYIEKVSAALTGKKRVGKSKTAQYGQVEITTLDIVPSKIETNEIGDYALVYVQSSLCVFDEYGQPTYQPTAKDLELEGEIDWSKSLIRAYSYSPWNGKRNTNDTLRSCIAAGSVLYITGKNEKGEKSIGAFQAEGLGRVIVNPVFLEGVEEAKSTFELSAYNPNAYEIKNTIPENPKTPLGKFLKKRLQKKKVELELSQAIQETYQQTTRGKKFQNVSASQWGEIRAYAIKATKFEELKNDLLDGKNAYLKHGVAYDRIWSKGKNLNSIEEVFESAGENPFPTTFIAKFAAEMAKQASQK